MELWFSDLPQPNWWRCRFFPEDHVSEIGFEFRRLDLCGLRFFHEKPKRNRASGREIRRKWAKKVSIPLLSLGPFGQDKWTSGRACSHGDTSITKRKRDIRMVVLTVRTRAQEVIGFRLNFLSRPSERAKQASRRTPKNSTSWIL